MPRTKQPTCTGFVRTLKSLLADVKTARNCTITQIASEIGITRQSLNQYVSGKSEPNYVTLIEIANYFGVTTDYLLGRTEETNIDLELNAISEYTGLSSSCCKTLHDKLISKDISPNETKILSDFILSDADLQYCKRIALYLQYLQYANDALATTLGYSAFLDDACQMDNAAVDEQKIHQTYQDAEILYDKAMFQRFHAQEISNEYIKSCGKEEMEKFKSRLSEVYNQLYGTNGKYKSFHVKKSDTSLL